MELALILALICSCVELIPPQKTYFDHILSFLVMGLKLLKVLNVSEDIYAMIEHKSNPSLQL